MALSEIRTRTLVPLVLVNLAFVGAFALVWSRSNSGVDLPGGAGSFRYGTREVSTTVSTQLAAVARTGPQQNEAGAQLATRFPTEPSKGNRSVSEYQDFKEFKEPLPPVAESIGRPGDTFDPPRGRGIEFLAQGSANPVDAARPGIEGPPNQSNIQGPVISLESPR